MGLLNFLAPRREQRNVLADVLRRKSMADNAPVNALAAPGGLLAIPGVPKQKSVMGGLLAASSVAPGIGDFTGPMADAHMYATDPSSRTPGNYAMSALGLLPFVPSLAGITAFHGSPHLFGNFDMSKIGTGEGAQAYGHGLYFAEAPDVAKQYADNVKDMGAVTNINAELSRLAKVMESDAVPGGYRKFKSDVGRDAAARYDDLMSKRSSVSNAPGNMYTVDIPDEAVARMLDWDAPLSEQPEAVRKAIMAQVANKDSALGKAASRYALNADDMQDASGKFILELLGGGPAASQELRGLGITGLKYLDQGSRSTGKGTRNFVVFDDKLPKILKRD